MKHKVENIIKVIEYIEAHLNEKIGLEEVANAIGYSKYHLHRMFTSITGLSIHDYIQRRQLSEAAKLLIFSNKSIMEISLIAGYESQQAFTNVFKQMYKKSPNEFRKNEEFYPLQLEFNMKNETISSGNMDVLEQDILFASNSDIPLWMDLVNLIIDGYPNLNEEEYLIKLRQYIAEKRALIIKDKDIAVAVMAFNYTSGSINFFGVHPLYRNYGIAKMFLNKLMNELLIDKDIYITTFREGDKADTGYRSAYKELGFAEAELLVEFGYPTQKFILSASREHKNG